MYRLLGYGTVAIALCTFLGCAMCCGPYDDDYNLYGGRFQRVDPAQGRVGSILSDPAYRGGGPIADSNLEPEAPRRSPNDLGELDEEDEAGRLRMEQLRRELQLDNDGNELPRPTPQPDTSGNRETSRGWQNRLRDRNRQWR